MAEVEIKRVNFFDGQFLKQGEFNDLSNYMVHMRRRFLFVLFNQSGVIQAGGGDLQLDAPIQGQKVLRVRAGMAIGKRPDLAEAKEIILRDDAQIDLTTVQNTDVFSVPVALQGTDTGIVTIHYDEQSVKDPPSEGDVSGDTRIKERARITVHRNQLPGTNAPNGEPYIRLGNVAFANMQIDPAPRQTAFLQSGLLAATPQISLNPNTVPPSDPVTMTVTSSGGLNLSGATAASVNISNMTGITNLAVSNQQQTSMTLNFTLTNAAAGARTVTITVNNVSASATFTVQAGVQLASFSGVDEPNNDLLFKINGSGFQAPVTVEFTTGPSTFAQITAAPTITPNQITFPMSSIPSNAIVGPARINQTVVSSFNVTPPAAFVPNTLSAFNPPSVAKNALLTINGMRFFGTGTIVFGGNASVTLPPTGTGESMSPTQITVRVPGTATSGTVTITTPGGIVRSAATLVVL